MELPVTQISSDHFSVSRAAKRLTCFHSDLPRNSIPYEPLYDDACDVGFAVRSTKTGQVTRWYFAHHNRTNDVDNELVETVFEPCTETVRKFPQLEGYRLFIGND
jgi:hypothetical protein